MCECIVQLRLMHVCMKVLFVFLCEYVCMYVCAYLCLQSKFNEIVLESRQHSRNTFLDIIQ